jgi:nitrogen fixation-related uncharacterized protein
MNSVLIVALVIKIIALTIILGFFLWLIVAILAY